MKFSIQKKIMLGFGAVLTLMAFVTISNLVNMGHIEDDRRQLLEIDFPSVTSGIELSNSINLTLSALRGYMILGDDSALARKFKDERQTGWDQIDLSLQHMSELSQRWTIPSNAEKFSNMKDLIEEFRIAQQEVEDISHTPANIPALDLLITEAAPRATKIINAITSMIDAESDMEATPERKALLKLLADSRGSFAIGLASIRAFLLTGDAQFSREFNAKWAINDARFASLAKPEVLELFNTQQSQAWNSYRTLRNEFAPLPPKMFNLRKAEDWNLANYWLSKKAAPKAMAIFEILNEMRTSQEQMTKENEELLIDDAQRMKVIMITGTFVALAGGIFISIWVSRMISFPLRKVVRRAEAIGNGDLSGVPLEVTGNDELTDLTVSINTMSNNLKGTVNHIIASSQQLGSSAEELSAVTHQTSLNLVKQQTQTDSVATAMNEMTMTVQEVAMNIASTVLAAQEANTETAEGSKLVDDAKKAIQQLAIRIESASGIIAKLEQDSKEISTVMEVIRSIADQTNLLALNAAIEAARAGEQGRGFAVVADEVRALASRTQDSTENINQVIEKLQQGSRDAVDVMNKSHEEAQLAVTQASKTGVSLSAISSSVERINSMSFQIGSAAEQQISTSEEINHNVLEISQVAQETTSGAQQTAIASEELARLASDLQEVSKSFKV
jgi:methyl-accepting chemotaxis protein